MNNNSKNKILTMLAILIILISFVGISYAIYRFTKSGDTTNYITTGTVSMQYTESNTNVISIKNAMPLKDSVGKQQKDYFDFTLSSSIHGNAKIVYEIRAKQLSTSQTNELDPQDIKVYLEKKENGVYKEVLPPTNFKITSSTKINTSENDSMLLYTGEFNNMEKLNNYYDDYRLRMWVDESTDIGKEEKSFKLRVDVIASVI